MIRIAVIDGQGGGIGGFIIRRLREEFEERVEILALGTNAAATSAMMKARANKGATGENAIVWNAARVDIITGPLSIIISQGMLGEVTPAMTQAISSSAARKILLPLNQEGIDIIGTVKEPLPHFIDHLIETLKEDLNV